MTDRLDEAAQIYYGDDGCWHGGVTIGVSEDGRPVRRHTRGRSRAEVVRVLARLQQANDAGTGLRQGKRQEVAGPPARRGTAPGARVPAPRSENGATPTVPACHVAGVPNSRLLLKVEEAADALAISRWKVFELIRCDELRTVKIGGLRRIPRSAIEAYVERLLGEAR
jgi:excisionase family DNA binding protein